MKQQSAKTLIISIIFSFLIPLSAPAAPNPNTPEMQNLRKECNNVMDADKSVTACSALIIMGLASGQTFLNRSVAYGRKENLALAMKDIDQAIGLEPDLVLAHIQRGSLYIVQGKYQESLTDLDQAEQAAAKSPTGKQISNLLYTVRGNAKFYAVSPASALDDFTKAVQADPSAVYSIIWLHLAKQRLGLDDSQEFEKNSARAGHDWPAPLLALYSGKLGFNDALVKAKDLDPFMQADQLCDVNFYTAELYLTQNKKQQALPLFQEASDHCALDAGEKSFARTEMVALRGSIRQ
jgi:lipoprotein NlpI